MPYNVTQLQPIENMMGQLGIQASAARSQSLGQLLASLAESAAQIRATEAMAEPQMYAAATERLMAPQQLSAQTGLASKQIGSQFALGKGEQELQKLLGMEGLNLQGKQMDLNSKQFAQKLEMINRQLADQRQQAMLQTLAPVAPYIKGKIDPNMSPLEILPLIGGAQRGAMQKQVAGLTGKVPNVGDALTAWSKSHGEGAWETPESHLAQTLRTSPNINETTMQMLGISPESMKNPEYGRQALEALDDLVRRLESEQSGWFNPMIGRVSRDDLNSALASLANLRGDWAQRVQQAALPGLP